MEEKEKLSLANLKGGAAIEMFDRAMGNVLDNIRDINTTQKPREITLKVRFSPTRDRTLFGIAITCTPKLAIQEVVETTAELRLDSKGKSIGYERFQPQQLPFGPTNIENIGG